MTENPWTWILIAAVGFGGGFPLSKALLDSGVGVWQFFAPRYVIAAAVILLFVTRRGMTDPIARRRGAVLGIVNVATPTVFLTLATDLLPASVAGILTAFIPVTTIAFAHAVVPGERFAVRRVPGVVLALIGAAILVGGSRSADGNALSLAGIVLGVVGVGSAGFGGALNRRFAMQTPAIELAASQFAASAIVLTIGVVPLGGLDFTGIGVLQWVGLMIMAVVSTAVPFYAILKAGELSTAATTANIGYLVPLIAAGGAVVFLGDAVTVGFAVGASAIVFGVWLSDRLARIRSAAQGAPAAR